MSDAGPPEGARPEARSTQAAPAGDTILLTRDATVATLTLNRPDALNTLDFEMVDALVALTSAVGADDSVQVVRLRAAGRHFMAGGDIQTFARELARQGSERRARPGRSIAGRWSSRRAAPSCRLPWTKRSPAPVPSSRG